MQGHNTLYGYVIVGGLLVVGAVILAVALDAASRKDDGVPSEPGPAPARESRPDSGDKLQARKGKIQRPPAAAAARTILAPPDVKSPSPDRRRSAESKADTAERTGEKSLKPDAGSVEPASAAPRPVLRESLTVKDEVSSSVTRNERRRLVSEAANITPGPQLAAAHSDVLPAAAEPEQGDTAPRKSGKKSSPDASPDANKKPPPGRFVWNEPPAGFSDLTETQTSLVDIYFHQRKVASTLAKFAPGWVRFEKPREIVEKLPAGVAGRDRIAEALTGELTTNVALLCTEPPKPGCGRLQPRVAGVIFDRDRFRADLFVNPDLLPVQAKNEATYMPDPDAGFSALQSFAAVYSGGTVSDESYNVQSFTLLGVDKTRLRANTSVSDTENFGVGVLVGEHERRDQIYRGGLFRSNPVPVLGDRPFYGVGFASTYKARLDLEQIRGSELVVFLPRPAQVDVLREGRIISSQSFAGGNQALDTSTFPSGAYDVLLRIKESGGSVREERRFFAKSNRVPPAKAPRYVIEAGVLGGNTLDPFPETDTAPLLHGGATYRLLDEFAIGGDLALSTEAVVLSAEAFYLTRFVTLSLGGFGATDRNSGVQFDAHGRFKSFSYGFGARHFRTERRPNEISLTNTASGGFTQLNLNLGYAFENGPRIGFRGFWRDNDPAPQTYSYGPTLHWTFFRKRRMRIALISDATFSDNESLAMARVRFSYDDTKFHFDAAAGYRAALSSDNATADGLLASTNGEWRKQDVLDGEIGLGAGVETQPSADVARANARYIGPRGQIKTFVQQDISNDHDTRYGGNLLFNVVGNSDTLTMGGANAYRSAVIVAIDGDAKADFQVLINGQPKGRIAAGQTLPFLLPDYRTYSVRLKAIGAPAIAFDTRTRHVSLYPATVKTLRWTVEPIVTLFARIVDAAGRPIPDARVQGGVETSYTDGNGYFQVDLSRKTELRVVRAGWDDCAVTFRSLPRDKEFISGKTLVCGPPPAGEQAEKPAPLPGQDDGNPAQAGSRAN